MRYLRDYANRADVQSFVRGVLAESQSELFQGVFVGYHPLWQMITQNEYADPVLLFRYGFAVPGEDSTYHGIQLEDPSADPRWKKVQNSLYTPGREDPYVIIFRLRPLERRHLAEYQKLVSLVESMGRAFFTRVEQRPLAKLYAQPSTTSASQLEGGLKIRNPSGRTGTLGGFLKDVTNSTEFGLTCAHVANVKDTIEYLDDVTNKWLHLGTCVESSQIPTSQKCNVNCYLSSTAVDVDAALIEIDSLSASSRIKNIFGQVDEIVDAQAVPRSVELMGAECGHLRLSAEKFGMWQELQLPSGQCACYRDLFEVNSNSIVNLGAKLSLLFSKIVRNGDSGAWVVAPNTNGNFSYCGNIIGGDTISGFATFSQNVQDWAKDKNRVNKARVLDVI